MVEKRKRSVSLRKGRKQKVRHSLTLEFSIMILVRYSDTMVMSTAEISKHSVIEYIQTKKIIKIVLI